MNLKEIQQLIDMINNSDIGEAIIEEADFKITLKRSSSLPAAAAQMQPINQAIAQPVAQQPTAAEPREKSDQPSAPANDGLTEIRSPIVGTFYRSPTPDADPFVNVQDTIENGQTLCIIEAMKLMNEIESDFSGTLVEILVENGQPVEYDQPLFLLKS